MRVALGLLLLVLLSFPAITRTQNPDEPRKIGFTISSLDDSFAFAGVFEGRIQVYPKRIEVTVNKGTIYLRDIAPYKGRRNLISLRVGLAKEVTSGEYRWKTEKESKRYSIDKVMVPGSIRKSAI